MTSTSRKFLWPRCPSVKKNMSLHCSASRLQVGFFFSFHSSRTFKAPTPWTKRMSALESMVFSTAWQKELPESGTHRRPWRGWRKQKVSQPCNRVALQKQGSPSKFNWRHNFFSSFFQLHNPHVSCSRTWKKPLLLAGGKQIEKGRLFSVWFSQWKTPQCWHGDFVPQLDLEDSCTLSWKQNPQSPFRWLTLLKFSDDCCSAQGCFSFPRKMDRLWYRWYWHALTLTLYVLYIDHL